MQFFLPKFFGATPPGTPHKNQNFEWLKQECYVFFEISRYLTDKYFDKVWRSHPPGSPPKDPPKIKFLNGLT